MQKNVEKNFYTCDSMTSNLNLRYPIPKWSKISKKLFGEVVPASYLYHIDRG